MVAPEPSILEPKCSIKVTSGAEIYLAIPPDGTYQGKPYRESGKSVAEKLCDSVPANYNIVITNFPEDGNYLGHCITPGAEYVLFPKIITYENRAICGNFSGKSDTITIEVNLYDLTSKKSSCFTYYAKPNMIVSGLFEWGILHHTE